MCYFEDMIAKNFFDLRVHYTNLYAGQKNKTRNVTASEMKCFLGILLLIGYVMLLRRSMCWEKSAYSDFSLLYSAISRDCFNVELFNVTLPLLYQYADSFLK